METNHNSPTDIFRFVNVRPPQILTSDDLEKNFLKHPNERINDANFWSNAFLTNIEKRNGKTLCSLIKTIPDQQRAYRTLVEEAVSKWESPFRFDSVDLIYKKYSELKAVADWLRINRNGQLAQEKLSPLLTVFLSNLQKLNGEQKPTEPMRDPKYDYADLQMRLWDNFVCQVVKGSDCNSQLREELSFLIKAAYFIEFSTSIKDSKQKLIPATIIDKIIVLPAFFPLPAIANDNSIAVAENSAVSVAKGGPKRGEVVIRKKVKGRQVFIGGNLMSLDDICTEQVDIDPCSPAKYIPLPQGHGQVKMLGRGDLLVVKKQLMKYEAGEIAHIENVMATESRKRELRNLEREELKTEQETETTTETEKELTTSDKFDLEKESNEIIKSDSSLEAGLTISASYGPVSATASLNYAQNNSQEESNKIASKMSKETTSRAVSKISEKVRELRSKLTIKEIEETNTHSFDNTKGPNTTGIYQFVDKIYRAQVYNYGARLFLELIVPRPAAQYIYFKANDNTEGSHLVKPIHPKEYKDSLLRTPLTSYEQITEGNYVLWAAVYNAQDVAAPPIKTYLIGKAYCLDYTPGGKACGDYSYNDLEVKEGYQAVEGYVNIGLSEGPGGDDPNQRYIAGFLGKRYFETKKVTTLTPIPLQLDNETGVVPFSFRGICDEFNINVEIKCNLTTLGTNKWKSNTFNSIMNAYQRQLDEYNEAVARMEFGKTNFGNNPNINRIIEAEEIKKGCIQIITDQHFDSFDALQYNRGPNHYPEFDNAEAKKEGEYIQFFEQTCEWTEMTYWFYPYFWGNKPHWTIIKQYEDNDPLFTKFLQAGAVRVMLPVRPGYEGAVQHYLSTGEIWNGGETPVINDPLYLSIVQEIREADEQTAHEPLEGSIPWEVKVPTNFVILNKDQELPKFPVHKPFIINANPEDKTDDYYPELKALELGAEIYNWES
jgi:hypothetical protein